MAIEVFGGDPNARAKVAADVKYGAQQSAVERAIAALAGQRQADEAGINKYGELGRTAIGQTFDQLVGNLETNRQMVNRDLGIQVDSVGQGFRDANSIAEAARQRALDNLAKTYGGNQAYSTTDIAKYQDPIETLAAQVMGENARNDATYTGNLKNWAAQIVFDFDRKHLNRVDAGLLVLPAGKSGHLELGYLIGLGKPGYILLDGEPDR